MENFIGAASLAMLSALGWIGYKHPGGYRKLMVPLMVAVWAIFLVCVGYTIGLEQGSHAVEIKALRVTNGMLPDLGDPEGAYRINLVLVTVGMPMLLTYLSVLGLLPRLLGLREEDEIKDEDHNGD